MQIQSAFYSITTSETGALTAMVGLRYIAVILCFQAMALVLGKPPAAKTAVSSKQPEKHEVTAPKSNFHPVKPHPQHKISAVRTNNMKTIKEIKHKLSEAKEMLKRHNQEGTKKLLTLLDKDMDREIEEKNASFRHHDYEEMTWLLKEYAHKYSNIVRLYDIGTSVQNRKLWVVEISNNPGTHEPGEPEVKYLSNMHGDEIVGREMLLHFVKYLCKNYGVNKRVTSLVDQTRIHIMPSMNPDGYEMAATKGHGRYGLGRRNANDVDLNRNFPDQFFPSTNGPPQPETRAVMEWIKSIPFVLSASLHSGALVANYPYDDNPSGQSVYSATPDDDVFRQLARAYSEAHPKMHLANAPWRCKDIRREHFIDGITNGAKWYAVSGGMQDYNYVHSNCFDVTLELGCEKFPNATELPSYWTENKEALLKYLEQAHKGVCGFVKDDNGDPIEGARISVANRRHDMFTAKDGDYWRLLVPGSYEVEVSAQGYDSETKTCTVIQDKETNLNFTLKKMRVRKTRRHELEDYPRDKIPQDRAFRGEEGEEESHADGWRARANSRRDLDMRSRYGDDLSENDYSARTRDRYGSEFGREDEKRSFEHERPRFFSDDRHYYSHPK